MKRHAWKRTLATILVLAMTLGMIAVPGSARSFPDSTGHWATEYIDKWSDNGVLQGNELGMFMPDREMSLSEVAKVISVLMGYTTTVENNFTDVPAGVWYEPYMLRLAAAGLIPTSGAVNPEKPATRADVFTLLAKAFELEPVSGETTFADNDSISAAQKPYIKALQDCGALTGKPIDGELYMAGNDTLTRSELVKMFDGMAGNLLNIAGDYTENYPGNLVINTSDVNLSGVTIEGNLYIAAGVAGTLALDGVTVKGTIFILGSAEALNFTDVKADKIVFDAEGVTANFSGNSFANTIEVRDDAEINYDGAKGYKLTDRVIVPEDADGIVIDLGNVNAGVFENNGSDTKLEGTANFTKKEGNGTYSKDSTVIIGGGSIGGGTVNPPKPDPDPDPEEKTITLISFNDFHGSLDKSVSASNPGADRFVGFLKAEIAKAPDTTRVLVAGDNYQGSALSNLNLGKPVSDMIKSIGSKFSAIGNHEFDWGPDRLEGWAEDGGITFLAANIIDSEGNTPDYCEPYAIEVIDGVKVGIIGFITTSTPTLVKAEYTAGMEFADPAPIATELAAKLREEEGCDIVIALTHMGANQSAPNTDAAITGEAARLAEAIAPGTLDAIISGHSHTKIAGTVNGTPIVQGAYNGRGVGKLEFNLVDGVLESVTPIYIDVNKDFEPADAAITDLIVGYNAALAPILAEIVGYVDGPFAEKSDMAYWAGELVYQYILRNTGDSYVLIQNDGGWRGGTYGDDSPKDNTVTMGYLYTLMPFDNEIVLIAEMSGTDLLGILSGKNTAGDSFTSKPDINGAYEEDGKWYLADGTEIVADGTYKVACNDFMLTGGDKYDWFIPYSVDDSKYEFIGTPLRDAMADQLRFEAGIVVDDDERAINIFFTSDLHGAFAGKNYATGAAHGGLSRVAKVLNEQKADAIENGRMFLTLDVGDTIQGAGTSGFIGSMDYQYPLIKSFNYLEYDAVILGNHEFNFGVDNMLLAYNGEYEGTSGTIKNDLGGFNGANLAGNVMKGSTFGAEQVDGLVDGTDPLLPGFKSYEVFDLNGVRVAVIGMTNPGSDMWDAIKMREAGYYTESAIYGTKRAIEEIKAGDLADVIVLAAHMGTGDSFDRPGSGANSVLADPYIAENVDVFLGGHGHSMQTREINGVRYGENRNAGASLGNVTIQVTKVDGKWTVVDKLDDVSISMTSISSSAEEDAGYLEHMAPEMSEAVAYTEEVIGTLTGANMILPSPLSDRMNLAYTEPTKLVEFIHDVQRYYAEAQISIACPFSTSVQHAMGDITRGSLIGIYNYDSNTVYKIDMAGWQVDRFMEYIARTQYNAPNAETDLSIRHSTSYRNDSLGGVKYTMDLTQPEGDRVTITEVKKADNSGWEAYNPNSRYIVAANDYRTSSTIFSTTSNAVFTEAELEAVDAPVLVKVDCNRDKPIAPDILSLMVDYITNVKGGTIDGTDYEKNWEITPWWDADLRAEGEVLIAEGYITGISASSPLTIAKVMAGRAAKALEEGTAKVITLISFNDFHGSLDKSVSASNPGADRFVGFLKAEIAKAPDTTRVLVAGDNYQGSALSNLNLGKPVSDMIQSIGSKFSAIGNHEFDWGPDRLEGWAEDGGITFLAANIIDSEGNTPDYCEPYAIEVIDGVKVGIIGFITTSTPTLVKAEYTAGMEFADPAPIATELAAKLREEEGCDIVIALTHMGANQSAPNTDAVITGEAAKLANDIAPGTLDAIISGHSHTKIAGTVNGTPIVQGAYNGRGIGKLEFTVSAAGEVLLVTPSYVDVNKDFEPADAVMTAIIGGYNAALAPILAEIVGYVDGPFAEKSDMAYWAGELVYQYILRNTGDSYVLIQNDGGWRGGTYGDDSPANNIVTMGYLYTLMPFDNEIVLIAEMSGTDLLGILSGKNTAGDNFTSKADVNGAYSEDGKWYLADGTEIVATGTYKVACNDFMLTGGDKYDWFIPYSADGDKYEFIGTPLRDAMADQLRFEAGIETDPEVEYEAGDTYDFRLLFTSDLHGSFSDWRYSAGQSGAGLSRIATAIEARRNGANRLNADELSAEKAEARTMLIDIGDTIQGNGTGLFHGLEWDENVVNTAGMYPLLYGMELLKYDVWVMGNHEFNFGMDRLEKAYGKDLYGEGEHGFSGAILGGNVFVEKADNYADLTVGDNLYDSFYVRKMPNGGPNVAIIGMTHSEITQWDAYNVLGAGLNTKTAAVGTQEAIAYLLTPEAEEVYGKIDVFVGAMHVSDGNGEDAGDGIIAMNPELDLFLGAHGHSARNKMSSGTRFMELPGNASGACLGQVDVTVTYQADGTWKVEDRADDVAYTAVNPGNNALASYKEDPTIAAAHEVAKAYSEQPVGTLTGGPLVNPTPVRGVTSAANTFYTYDNALNHLFFDAFMYASNEFVDRTTADWITAAGDRKVTLAASCALGSGSTNSLQTPGPITRAQIGQIYTYDNNTLCIIELTGHQLKVLAEQGFTSTRSNGNVPNQFLSNVTSSSSYNNMLIGGDIYYTVDMTRPAWDRIVDMRNPDGSPFDMDGVYWMAANNHTTGSRFLAADSKNADGSIREVLGASHLKALDDSQKLQDGTGSLLYEAEFDNYGEYEAGMPIVRTWSAQEILTLDGADPINNGEGATGMVADYVLRKLGGNLTNAFTPNWRFDTSGTPSADWVLYNKAVEIVNADIGISYNGSGAAAATPANISGKLPSAEIQQLWNLYSTNIRMLLDGKPADVNAEDWDDFADAMKAAGDIIANCGTIESAKIAQVNKAPAAVAALRAALEALGYVEVNLLSFNDFHGALDKLASSSNPGVDRFTAVARKLLTDLPNSTLLAAGDNYQGSAISNYFYGKPVSDMMKELDVQYSAIGNHDYDWGANRLAQFSDDAGGMQFLAANIFLASDGVTRPAYCEPYATLEIGGKRIGIVGWAHTGTPTLVKAEYVADVEFRSNTGTWLADEVADWKAENNWDAVVALTHGSLGGADLTGTFDAIILGHSHATQVTTVGGVPAVQANYNGRDIGRLQFIFDADNNVTVNHSTYGATSVNGSTIIDDQEEVDTDMKAKYQVYFDEVEPIFSQEYGVFGDIELGNNGKYKWANTLVYDYIARVTAEPEYVVIQNSGGWRSAAAWPTDVEAAKTMPVDMWWLNALMPFDNEIYLFQLDGEYLINLLNGRRVNGVGTTASGGSANAHKVGDDWFITSSNTKIEAGTLYKVSMNDFMFTGGDNFGVVEGANGTHTSSGAVPLDRDYAVFTYETLILGVPLRDAMADQLLYRAAQTGGGAAIPLAAEAYIPVERPVEDTAVEEDLGEAVLDAVAVVISIGNMAHRAV